LPYVEGFPMQVCPVGSFAPSGSTRCLECKSGSYNAMKAAGECTSCPFGTVSKANASQCTDVRPGYWCKWCILLNWQRFDDSFAVRSFLLAS
jgi:ribosomal protein L37E